MRGRPFDAGQIMFELTQDIEQELGRMALRAFTAVVLATPVGNPSLWEGPAPPGYVGGHARRNWHITTGRKSDAELPGVDGTGQLTIAAGAQIIEAWSGRNSKRVASGKEITPLHIQNAVPYIGRLNAGHSMQAPAGFVEKAVLAATGQTSGGGRREL